MLLSMSSHHDINNTNDICTIYSNFSNYDFLILVAEFRIFAGLRIFFIPLKNRNIIRFQKS